MKLADMIRNPSYTGRSVESLLKEAEKVERYVAKIHKQLTNCKVPLGSLTARIDCLYYRLKNAELEVSRTKVAIEKSIAMNQQLLGEIRELAKPKKKVRTSRKLSGAK